MARRYKDIIDPFYFQRLAEVESSNNPNAEASTSSATGLYQFTKGTWEGLVDQLGLNYTLEDRKDPEKALKVVKEFTKQNRNYLKNRLGKEPNRAELYLSHFLGMGGSSKLLSQLQKNPNATVDTVATQAQINANRNVFLNKDGSLKKVKDIYNWSAKKFEEDPYDDAIYSYDQEGNVTNIDPKTATPQQKERSKEIKKNFYSEKSQQAIKELKFQNDMLTDPFAFVQPPPQQKEAPQEQQSQQEQKTKEPPQYVQQQQPVERQPITQSLPSEAYELYTPQENEFLQYFLQEGGENPKEYKSKDFFQDYLSSDIYLDRLRKQGWKMPELIRDTRLDKLKSMEAYVGNYGDEMGSTYLPYNNSLMVNIDEAEKYGDDIDTVLAHETSHGLGARQHKPNHVMRLNKNETIEINQRNKDKSIEHDGRAHELKADIDALRYKMFEDGIHDTTKGDVNKEQIQKAKSKYKNNTFIKRVFDRLNDDDLIYLMNNIATTTGPDNNFYGQEGGQISQKEANDIEKYIRIVENTYENNRRKMAVDRTANTWENMFGNVGTYFFGSKDDNLLESQYRPTVGAENKKYYTRLGMKEDVFNDLTSHEVQKDYNHSGDFEDIFKALKANGEDREHNADDAFPKNKAGYKGMYNKGHGSFKGQFNFGRYTVDAGEDDKGRYISFYDVYDWNGMKTENAIPFYDRIYEDEWKTYQQKIKNSPKFGLKPKK